MISARLTDDGGHFSGRYLCRAEVARHAADAALAADRAVSEMRGRVGRTEALGADRRGRRYWAVPEGGQAANGAAEAEAETDDEEEQGEEGEEAEAEAEGGPARKRRRREGGPAAAGLWVEPPRAAAGGSAEASGWEWIATAAGCAQLRDSLDERGRKERALRGALREQFL